MEFFTNSPFSLCSCMINYTSLKTITQKLILVNIKQTAHNYNTFYNEYFGSNAKILMSKQLGFKLKRHKKNDIGAISNRSYLPHLSRPFSSGNLIIQQIKLVITLYLFEKILICLFTVFSEIKKDSAMFWYICPSRTNSQI